MSRARRRGRESRRLSVPTSPKQRFRHRVVFLAAVGLIASTSAAAIAVANLLDWYINPIATGERIEVAKTFVQILAAMVVLGGLFFTARTLRLNQQGQITERFTRAIDQLGATDKDGAKQLEVRLGGIYALARIARDSEKDHWPIMQILMAYIRTNSPWPPKDPSRLSQLELPLAEHDMNQELLKFQPPVEVEAILQVFRERGRHFGDGEPGPFELSRTDLRGALLYQARFEYSNFSWANLALAKLFSSNLRHANFFRADLRGAELFGAKLQEAKLIQACLIGADMRFAELQGANFAGAQLHGGNLSGAYLQGTNPEAAESLTNTNMIGATGLTHDQRRACADKGAIIEGSVG